MSGTMHRATAPAETAYEAFAPFYDRFIARSDYEAWTDNVEPVVRAHAPGRGLLDLACGTGKSAGPFQRRGYAVTGCDISEAMLARARERVPGARFVRGDLRELPRIGRFDALTCFGDSLNYLTSDADLEAAFRSASRNLAPSGALVFDVNTLAAYRTTFATDQVTDQDGVTFIWRGRATDTAPPGCTADATIDVLRPAADGLYEVISTLHRQRHHPAAAIAELLDRAGLEPVAALGVRHDGSLAPAPDEERLLKTLHVARLRKGGGPEW
jgi:SAM-dependent methyltransferase